MKAITTIVNHAYLAYAAVLMASAKATCPDYARLILVTDATSKTSLPSIDAAILTLNDLALPPAEIRIQSHIYDIVEFATALKPPLLQYLRQEYSSVTYLDPDTYLYGSLALLDFDSQGLDVSLTPHRLTPPPIDGLLPNERLFKAFGVFNLGYICVQNDDSSLLQWWSERTRRSATKSVTATEFTDQRWMDFAPAYYRVHICRYPGANVAPWNLDERSLSVTDGEIQANGSALAFAHFSAMRSFLGGHTDAFPNQTRLDAHSQTYEVFSAMAQEWWSRVSEAKEEFPLKGVSPGEDVRVTPTWGRLAQLRYRTVVKRAESRGAEPPPTVGLIWRFRSSLLEKFLTLYSIDALIDSLPRDLERLRTAIKRSQSRERKRAGVKK